MENNLKIKSMGHIECIELINELNEELYDKHGEVEEHFFFTTNGFIDLIGFGDITIWNSEDDGRKWIEKNNDYEPMKPFIKRELKKYLKKLTLLTS